MSMRLREMLEAVQKFADEHPEFLDSFLSRPANGDFSLEAGFISTPTEPVYDVDFSCTEHGITVSFV